jgi:hypothetical protein
MRLTRICALILSLLVAALPATAATPDATTADGGRYYGPLLNGRMQGPGRMEWDNGTVYEGEFANGLFEGQGRLAQSAWTYRGEFRLGMQWGHGELVRADGSVYRGEFERDELKGHGRFESTGGDVYEGEFDKSAFTGHGVLRRRDGSRYEGEFRHWQLEGPGAYTDPMGNVYAGTFLNGELVGKGKLTSKAGARYEGELSQWVPNGEGVMFLANGDVYRGRFAGGMFDGVGKMTYAKPRPDGRTVDEGVWRFGRLQGPEDRDRGQARANVETALYRQRRLLDDALSSLTPATPGRVNLFLLAVAGDGSQEVFRREVDFVRNQFDTGFGTRGHSIALINSRNTVDTAPMATLTSIREALDAIAKRMDRDRDVLFLFLTSHGSRDHELTLDLPAIDLANLKAKELAGWVKATGIRWKVIVISACYAGGFIEPLEDERTLVIAAARRDRQSFGCADENDFTYFGRAYFKEALPQSGSFAEAFRKAEVLVGEWEAADRKGAAGDGKGEPSLPQMSNPTAIEKYLEQWRAQLAKDGAKR